MGRGPCRGQFFTRYSAGPVMNSAEFEGWINHKLEICKKYNQAPQDISDFRLAESVLTHRDISPQSHFGSRWTGMACGLGGRKSISSSV